VVKKFSFILLLTGAALLGYLLWKTGIAGLWQEMKTFGWGLLPFVFAEGFAELIHTAGWRHCLSKPYRSIPFLRLFRIRMSGYAINYLTPTASLGGEATKAAMLAAYYPSAGAVTGVLVEKVCFGLAHLLFVILTGVIFLRSVALPRALFVSMILSGGCVGVGLFTFLTIQRKGKLGELLRWLAQRFPSSRLLRAATENITKVDAALRDFYREHPRDLWLAVLCHLIGYCVGIFQTWLFLRLLTPASVSLSVAGALWSIGMWFDLLTFAVPMNAGSLEGSRVLTLKALGYGPVIGMAYGLALRLAQLFWACAGLALYAGLTFERRPTTPVNLSSRDQDPLAAIESAVD
jgi:hypothetical protein